jgi:ribosome biogenesis GTPase A
LSQIAIAKKMIEDLITYELHAPTPTSSIPPHHRKQSTPSAKAPVIVASPAALPSQNTSTSNLYKYLRDNHSKLNVLVLGQARSGKSSFIRSMKYLFNTATDNYLKTPLSVDFRDKMGAAVFEKGILPHEQVEEDHTSKCVNNYLIFPDRHLIIDFIDTPGLRSKNITNQNEELVKDINIFLKNIPQIAHVILVVDVTHDNISEV